MHATRRSPTAWADLGMMVVCFLILLVSASRLGLIAVETVKDRVERVDGFDGSSGEASGSTSLARAAVSTSAFRSWWGGRPVPYREGGDYLGVLSRHSTAKSMGSAIGVIAERYRAEGVLVERILTPENRERLFNRDPSSSFDLVGGGVRKGSWPSMSYHVARISDVPVHEVAYDPVLTPQQLETIESRSGLKRVKRGLFVPQRISSHSGVWAVYRKPGDTRGYVFAPVDLVVEGGDS